MKKLGKNIVIFGMAVGLVACGGGTTTSDTQTESNTSRNTPTTNTTNNTPTETNTSTPSITTSTSSDITEYLKVINNARAVEQDCGTGGIKPAVGAVVWNTKLEASAMEHTKDLATWSHGVSEAEAVKRFTHGGSGTSTDITAKDLNLSKGSTVSERIEHAGYNYQTNGENLSAGTSIDTAVEVIQTWIDSPAHCVILMNASFTEVGMARVEDSNAFYINYWTQNFGKPMP